MATLTNKDRQVDYLTSRYRNSYNSAEGPQNPPRQTGEFRVPFVSGLKVLDTKRFNGQTQFTLTFTEPANSLQFIDHYNIYVIGSQGVPLNITASGNVSGSAIGPVTVHSPPAVFNVLATAQQNVAILVQTVLTNGMSSTLETSPRTGGVTFAPGLLASDFLTSILNASKALVTDASGAASFGTVPAGAMTIFGPSGPSHSSGAVPDPGAVAGTTKFLREDATWDVVPGSAINFSDNETPTGTINGTTGSDGNPTFTLAHSPSPGASLILVKNGLTQFAGTAYTLAANAITYNATYIPVTGDLHRVWYRY